MDNAASTSSPAEPAPQATNGKENVWETLPNPLSDLFLQEIIPKFLTVPDFAALSAVCRRYRTLLDPNSPQGNRIVAAQLRQQAQCYAPDGTLLYTNQLPSIGRLSVEESLERHAWWVAQLYQAALRRRSLLLFPPESYQETGQGRANTSGRGQYSQMHHRNTVFAKFRSLDRREPLLLARRYQMYGSIRTYTKFTLVNMSGRDIYCHWIDTDGDILIRDGDLVPSKRNVTERQSSFDAIASNPETMPPHIFSHSSQLYHSFALCYQEGGNPFALYRQNRGWYINRRLLHTHAIAVLPGGQIEELHLLANFSYTDRCIYEFYDREDGFLIQDEVEETNDGSHTEEAGSSNSARRTIPSIRAVSRPSAKVLANDFYGTHIPPFTDGIWIRGGNEFVQRMGGPSSPAIPNRLGEALWYHEQREGGWGRPSTGEVSDPPSSS